MKTLVIRTFEAVRSTSLFPKANALNIPFFRQLDGNGVLKMTLTAIATGNLTIKGGVFIVGGSPVTTLALSVGSNVVSFKATAEKGIIYGVPDTAISRLFVNWENLVDYTPNSPMINFKDLDVQKLSILNSMFRFYQNILWQDISNWDTSKIYTMNQMFDQSSGFNQDITKWNVSNVLSMFSMFNSVATLKYDISVWNFNKNVNLDGFFGVYGSYMYYDNLLIKLASMDWTGRTQSKVLGMGVSKYTALGEAARAALVASGWTITDGGKLV